jgi:hypothetical protein
MNLPTIITMFYNIRKIENSNYNKNQNFYYNLSSKFILLLPYPLVIFIEPNNTELEDFILTIRKDKLDLTYIYKFNLEDTYYFQYINQINENKNHFTIHNINLEKDTTLYLILNHNKFFFIEKAIELNFFNSSHFAYIDFGINHVAKNLDEIHNWFLYIPNKIKQLCINPFIENINPKEYFQYIYHNNAGGLFTGSKENLLKYSELFKNKWLEIINDKWFQFDEVIMSMVIRDNYDMFDLYYGDYECIICNYLKPNAPYNLNLIISNLKKVYNCNNLLYLFNMLKYLIPYYQISENQNNEEFYKFIDYNILSNYYYNEKMLLKEVINIINQNIIKKNNNLINLIKYHHDNLQYYINKNLIIKHL